MMIAINEAEKRSPLLYKIRNKSALVYQEYWELLVKRNVIIEERKCIIYANNKRV
jgi:hypothetical protein